MTLTTFFGCRFRRIATMTMALINFAMRMEARTVTIDVPSSRQEQGNLISGPEASLKSGTTWGQDLLARALNQSQERYSTLRSFVCREEIKRFKGDAGSPVAHSIDTVTAEVSFEDGSERYLQIRRKDHALAKLSDLKGIWSEGEFGSLLTHAIGLMQAERPVFKCWDKVDGIEAAKYQLDVAADKSPWNIYAFGGENGQHYSLPFRATVWISRASDEILKIEEDSTSVAPQLGASEIRWTVTLKQVNLNGEQWLLPKVAEYEVLEPNNKRLWNAMTFSGYRRYGAEVKLRFD